MSTFDREYGLEEIRKAIDAIKIDLIPFDGDVVISKEPQVVLNDSTAIITSPESTPAISAKG